MSSTTRTSPDSSLFLSSRGVISTFVVGSDTRLSPVEKCKYNHNSWVYGIGVIIVAALNLEEALKQVLEDDGKISKYEAKVIREIIMADGHVSQEEKDFLEKALRDNNFDQEAFELLSGVLLRSHLKD